MIYSNKAIIFVIKTVIFLIVFYIIIKTSNYCKTKQRINTIVIISSTFYNHSKIYPENTVVVHFNAYKNISLKHTWYCVSSNSANEKIISPIFPHKPYFQKRLPCKMQTFAANCTTVANATYFALAAKKNAENVQLLLRNAIHEDLPVVSCVSPLFFNERWQINMLSIEIYAYFGVSRQAYYYMSVLEDGFRLLKEYEKLRIIDLHPWIVPNVGETRKELEFRNQATAHNDCFLLYREAADFIIIHDPDDILILQNAKNLWSSFTKLFFNYPNTGAFEFSRINTEVQMTKTLKNTSFGHSLKSLHLTNKSVWFKSVYFTRGTETVDSHEVAYFHKSFKSKVVEKETGSFYHVRNISLIETFFNATRLLKDYVNQNQSTFSSILKKNDVNQIEKTFAKRLAYFLKLDGLKDLSHLNYYYDLVDACYEKVYYKIEGFDYPCPNHYQCVFPQLPGVRCVQSQQKYSKNVMSNIIIFAAKELAQNVSFENGCSLD